MKQRIEICVIVILCAVALTIACPDPEYRIKFEDHGKLSDPLHIERKQDHIEVYLVGWTEYSDTTQYVLTLGVQVRVDGAINTIEIQSDSIRAYYNSTSMIPAGIQTWERDNQPEKGKYAFSKKFICSPDLSRLPKTADGTVADVRLLVSLTGLIQFDSVPIAFDTIVGWERKAKRHPILP